MPISAKNNYMRKTRVPNGWWNDYDHCLEEAKKYTTLTDFMKYGGGCYDVCRRNGWLKDFYWLENGRCRIRKKGYPIAQFTLDGVFIREWKNAAEAARHLGMINGQHINDCCKEKRKYAGEYRWLYLKDIDRAEEIFARNIITQKVGEYTEEEIIEAARRYAETGRTRSDFIKEEQNYYNAASRLGILDKLPLERKLSPWRDNIYSVYVYEFKETHSAYIGLTSNKKKREYSHKGGDKRSPVYKHSVENGIQIPEIKYLIEGICQYDALEMEKEYLAQYFENGWNIINKGKTGLKSGSLGAVRKLSERKIRDAAKECIYRGVFATKYPNLHMAALRRGILDDLGLLNAVEPNGTYTEEYCYNAAKACRTMKEFQSLKPATFYAKSHKMGWIKQYWWLWNGKYSPVLAVKGFKIRMYGSLRACAESIGKKRGMISDHIKSGIPIDGWKYHYIKMDDIEYDIPDFEDRLVV